MACSDTEATLWSVRVSLGLCLSMYVYRVDVLRFANADPGPQQTDSGKQFIFWLATLPFIVRIPAKGKVRRICYVPPPTLNPE